jgi:hypothetical protein
MPGQVGLNAGILPSPGFTYVWAIEDLFYFVPDTKFLGGNLGFDIMFPTPATGSLVADINVQGVPNLSGAGGGSGLADLWIQPFTIGWHLKRWDLQVGEWSSPDLWLITGQFSESHP